MHHEYVQSVAIAAMYTDKSEFVFMFLLPQLLLGKQMHFLTYLLFIIMIIHESHDTHSGYSFPWSPHRIIPFTWDAEAHIFHHWKFKGNYSNYFWILDRAFGTVNESYMKYFNDKEKYLQDYANFASLAEFSEGEENENPDSFITKEN